VSRPLIECVPNFSEGRRPDIIAALRDAMARAGGVHILDVSSDHDHNRTVMTIIGLPEEVEKAILAGVYAASELINMEEHRGVHPRFGATDVIPFVPIRDFTMAECVTLAHRFGQRIATALNIPVYFYEAAALHADHRDLTNIRRPSFQYEQLKEQIRNDAAWVPDAGPAELGSAGASLVGARMPLIAFNVFLNTDDMSIAQEIARAVRYSSGGLRAVRSTAFLVNGRAQVSLNLTDYTVTPLHRAVELIRREASRYGAMIHSTELIGLIPEKAVLESSAWYLQMLDFRRESVLENRIEQAEAEIPPLGDEEPPIPEDATSHIALPATDETRRPEQFANAVAQATAMPGGGAVAALVGALGAALAEMTAGLTLGRKTYADVEDKMLASRAAANKLRERLIQAVSQDIDAFDMLMQVLRRAKNESDADAAETAIQQATMGAADIALKIVRMAYEVLQMMEQVVELGNHNAVIDAAVGAHMAAAAVESASMNVRVNLLGVNDPYLVTRYIDEVHHILTETRALHPRIIAAAYQRAGLDDGADL
jgi:glutamate formiminotransferase / formiminotetrahydrofolate cyclodeaminase